MDPRQQSSRGLGILPQKHGHLVPVAFVLQAIICGQSIGVDNTTWGNAVLDKAVQARTRCVGDSTHADSADAPSILFSRNSNQFLCSPSPEGALSFTTNVRLINLYASPQKFAAWSDHGTPQFVKPCPGRQITSQAENLLDTNRTGSVLLADDQPNGTKPES
jgi:hypothetical protein